MFDWAHILNFSSKGKQEEIQTLPLEAAQLGFQFLLHLGEDGFARFLKGGNLQLHFFPDDSCALYITVQQSAFRMVLLQVVPQVVVGMPVFLGDGKEGRVRGLILLPGRGEAFFPLQEGGVVPELSGALDALRPSCPPIGGNPVPYRVPRQLQLRGNGLIALPLSGKCYNLLPQGIRISYAAGHGLVL